MLPAVSDWKPLLIFKTSFNSDGLFGTRGLRLLCRFMRMDDQRGGGAQWSGRPCAKVGYQSRLVFGIWRRSGVNKAIDCVCVASFVAC